MQMVAEQMSLILENALLYVECQPSPIKSSQKVKSIDSKLDKKIIQEQQSLEQKHLTTENLALLGIYIIVAEGKFLYTNPGVAGIFGYTFMEFITVESIFELVATNNYELVNQQINQCLQSQNKILSCTFQGLRKDGTFIKVQAYGTKTKLNGKPVIIGILSSLRNI
jgi:PAS domain S-box-containing protein